MDSHSNKVLITGINGFTGKYLKEYLCKYKFHVVGISNVIQKEEDDLFACDINDAKQLGILLQKIKPDYIIHLAAISFVQHADLEEIYKVNVIGTQTLLEACLSLDYPLKKIILASSATVYGNQTSNVLHELLCPNPNNHYGLSKLAMEQIAKNYFKELPILIVRPFNYTAPGQEAHFLFPKIASAFSQKKPIIELGNIDVYREYNSIYYVCDIYHQLLKTDKKSEIVNICSGKTHSIKEIIEIFETKTKHKITVKVNPEFVRKNEIISLSGDAKKLNSLLETKELNSIHELIDLFISKNN